MWAGMHRDLERILIPAAAIESRVRDLGAQIALDLERVIGGDGTEDDHGELVIVPILTGSLVFVADLVRRLPLKLRLELVGVSSYPGKSMETKGVSIRHELPNILSGKHVLVIDDILDSGHTLDVVTRLIRDQKPASLRTCVLLRKPGKSTLPVRPDYVGFDIPDEFVVGYGLDYDGYYRNFPEIATLKPEAR
ncbi:hypoxanthine phosphoribosyltransferase [Phycisphaerales bacterium]|nr:hypoxanthine phosphoribosyltransferase [Phycisphaerales bacterium]